MSVFQALYFVSVVWGGVAVATVVGLGVPPVALTGWEAIRSRRLSAGSLAGVVLLLGAVALTHLFPAPELVA